MSMKRLILDRLIETVKQAADARIAEVEIRALQAEGFLRGLRSEFASANQRLTQVTIERDKLRKEAQESDVPLTELYRAAENMAKAKTTGQVNAARPRLVQALEASGKYIDQIPF